MVLPILNFTNLDILHAVPVHWHFETTLRATQRRPITILLTYFAFGLCDEKEDVAYSSQ